MTVFCFTNILDSLFIVHETIAISHCTATLRFIVSYQSKTGGALWFGFVSPHVLILYQITPRTHNKNIEEDIPPHNFL